MKIHKVNSQAVSKVGYDRANSKLVVQFKTGHTYNFTRVGKDMWTKLRTTDSIGKFMHDKILGRYTSKRVSNV